MFAWFDDKIAFERAIQAMEPFRVAAERWIESKRTVAGYCNNCHHMTDFQVNTGGFYDKHPNLREAMKCPECQLSNRNRLLLQAVLTSEMGTNPNAEVALLERLSALYSALHHHFPLLQGSEYLGDDKIGGQVYGWQSAHVRHESFTALSYPSAHFDLLLHGDILEHIYEYKKALAEAARVLRPGGGTMLCTVPFFMSREQTFELARPLADGSVHHHVEPEYHGDGLRPDGILTWYHFGWDLLDAAREAGFSRADFGIDYDPFRGFTSNNHPNSSYGLMYPMVLRAVR